MSRGARREEPTEAQNAALAKWRMEMGVSWRSKLLAAWECAGRGYSSYSPELQQLRNAFGPTWLTTYKIKPASRAELNGLASLKAPVHDLSPPRISGAAFTGTEVEVELPPRSELLDQRSITLRAIAGALLVSRPSNYITDGGARNAWYELVNAFARKIEAAYPGVDLCEFFDAAGVPS